MYASTFAAPHFIYFMRDTENGLIKVGFSHDPARRMKTLTKKVGHPLEMLAVSRGLSRSSAHAVEYSLHKILAVSSQRREWFYPSRMLALLIDACTNDPGVSSVFGSDHFYVRWLYTGAAS